MELDHGVSTLILCPKNLVPMWQHHVETYGLHAKIVKLSRAAEELPNVPARFRLVLIDESHNLRNREGQRYRAIQEYIRTSGSKVVLLSATPYNKTYIDLSNQLRLFVPIDADVGIRPEIYLRQVGETEFIRLHQCSPRSLPLLKRATSPTTGANSCGSTSFAARPASFRTITPRWIRKPAAST
ncbi:MAG: hypothetical protein WD894_23340 [Pirellulales bacterium]